MKISEHNTTALVQREDDSVLTLALYIALASVMILAATLLLALMAVDSGPAHPLLDVAAIDRSMSGAQPAPTGTLLTPVTEIVDPSTDPIITDLIETPIESTSADIRYFDGRPIRPVKTITMVVTAYSPDARSCAPFDDGYTASGYSVMTNAGKLIAADKRFAYGTLMSVPGYNGSRPTPVLDRGGAIKGNRLDVLFPTHEVARKWGRRKVEVLIWQYADEDPSKIASR